MARCVMGELNAVLDGGRLVPQLALRAPGDPRAKQLRPRDVTGAGVTPFLEDGAAVSSESWDQMVRAFEINFFGYAVWFN
jgi:hypothetical protein